MKKVFALLLVLTMVCVSVLAVAENSPATQTVTTVVVAPAEEAEEEVVVSYEENDDSDALVAEVAAAVAAGAPAISVYAEETQAAIAELVEDANALELIEVVAMDVENYESGDVVLTMSFATKFTAAQDVIVVITADDVDYVCDAAVTEAGDLEVTLDEATAAAVAAAETVVVAVFAK